MQQLPLDQVDILIVENVGNLVCPAEFDIGEDAKVAMLSVAEGEDKPAKYPLLFREADAVILSKVDLLPYVPFDVDVFKDITGKLNGNAEILEVSTTGASGYDLWLEWIRSVASISGTKLPKV